MNRRNLILGLVICLSLTSGQVFSQQQASTSEESGLPTQAWVLGDVVALDLESSQLILGYIDDDTGEPKEITIDVDVDTNYENVGSLEGIKLGDVVSVDYEVTPWGQVTALNISVERLKEVKQ